MTGVEAIAAVGPSLGEAVVTRLGGAGPAAAASSSPSGFGELLSAGMRSVDAKVAHADEMVQRFALDDSVPLHQVTYALEEARLSVELAMQVRSRLVESYRELMNMQL